MKKALLTALILAMVTAYYVAQVATSTAGIAR